MLLLPTDSVAFLVPFAPLFSQPVWRHVQVLLVGAVLAPGRRMVSTALRAVGLCIATCRIGSGRATWTRRSAALGALQPTASAEPVAVLEDTIRSLQSQRAWLGNYAAWQEPGYPVGSGLIGRAVAVVINWRMKRRGLRWSWRNVPAVVALRVQQLNAGCQAAAACPLVRGGTSMLR